jgi:hypothetical protein
VVDAEAHGYAHPVAEYFDFSKTVAWMTRARGRNAPAMSDVTAQDTYASMLKDRISPRLREAGLVGSAGRFSLPSDSHWALVGFQKSAFSDRYEVRFTINLVAVKKSDWDQLRLEQPHLAKRPQPTFHHPEPALSMRIGQLVDDGEDKWWRIVPTGDQEPIADEVIRDLTEAGIPWLREQISGSGR